MKKGIREYHNQPKVTRPINSRAGFLLLGLPVDFLTILLYYRGLAACNMEFTSGCTFGTVPNIASCMPASPAQAEKTQISVEERKHGVGMPAHINVTIIILRAFLGCIKRRNMVILANTVCQASLGSTSYWYSLAQCLHSGGGIRRSPSMRWCSSSPLPAKGSLGSLERGIASFLILQGQAPTQRYCHETGLWSRFCSWPWPGRKVLWKQPREPKIHVCLYYGLPQTPQKHMCWHTVFHEILRKNKE